MKLARLGTVILTFTLALFLASPSVMAKKDKKEVLYPNTTRVEPKLDLPAGRGVKKLNEGLDAANAGDEAKATELLQPFVDGDHSKYAKALALQALANIKYNAGDLKGAITLLQESLDVGVMPNDTYFQLMYELTQFYVSDGQYQKALASLTKWRAEGKRETADSYALEGNIDYRLQKYPEAIAAITKAKQLDPSASKDSWDQILAASYAESGQTDQAVALAKAQLAKHPEDTTTLRNAVAMLVTAQKYPEATALLEQARSSGALKESRDWVNLAKLYLMQAQASENPKPDADKAVAVLSDGLAKGALQPSYDIYKLQGDAANIGAEDAKALAFYQQAAPFAKDGEVELRVGQILINEGKYTEGKAAVNSAIAKGVKNEGSAYMLLGAAEANSKNRSAAIAAMKKAAQYPDTKAKAEAWLRQAGVK